MNYKQYKIYSGGKEYSIGSANLYWTALSDKTDKKVWFSVQVTNWDDNGYITGTYQLTGLSDRLLQAFQDNRLCIGVVRHRAAGQRRMSAQKENYNRYVNDRVEKDNYYIINQLSGTFRLNKPALDGGNFNIAKYIKEYYRPDHQGYQHVQLGFFTLLYAHGEIGTQYSPFIAIPNTTHTFYYDIEV